MARVRGPREAPRSAAVAVIAPADRTDPAVDGDGGPVADRRRAGGRAGGRAVGRVAVELARDLERAGPALHHLGAVGDEVQRDEDAVLGRLFVGPGAIVDYIAVDLEGRPGVCVA